jgi:hypothetical protein
MITIFDMASGETNSFTMQEPAIESVSNVAPLCPASQEVALRLMTVDEAVAMERRQAR